MSPPILHLPEDRARLSTVDRRRSAINGAGQIGRERGGANPYRCASLSRRKSVPPVHSFRSERRGGPRLHPLRRAGPKLRLRSGKFDRISARSTAAPPYPTHSSRQAELISGQAHWLHFLTR